MKKMKKTNQMFSDAIIKHLVGAVQEDRLADIMTCLPQEVILYLLGEFTPQEVDTAWNNPRYPKAVVKGLNILEARYLIEYEDTATRYFPTEEEAAEFSKTGRYDYNNSSYNNDDARYPYKGAWLHTCNTEVSWEI